MQFLQAQFLRGLTAGAAAAAVILGASAPALADRHDHATSSSTSTSAPRSERTYSAPRAPRTYSAPRAVERTYSAPRAYSAPRTERTYSAPRAERTYSAPRTERTYSAPRTERTYSAPKPYTRTYTAPRTVRTYSAPRTVRTYSAPRTVRTYSAPRTVRTYTAPRTVRTYTAPRTVRTYTAPHTVRTYTAPRTVRTYTAPRTVRTYTAPRTYERTRTYRSYGSTAVNAYRERRTARFENDRRVATSPLMRAVYAPRRTRTTVVYHPAYLTGRIVRETRNEVVLAPETGPQIVVSGYVPPTYYVNQYVTVPAVYNDGGYYAYPYSQDYQPQIMQLVGSLLGVPVSYTNGYYVPQNAYYGSMPYYGNVNNSYYGDGNYDDQGAYYGNTGYYNNGVCPVSDMNGNTGYTYCGAQASYATPYDNCIWTSDAYGNSYCAASQTAGYDPYYQNTAYSPYGSYGAYAPQQVQGLVVAKTGTMLMVLGGNGLNPIFVNEQPALQNGYAVNGPVAIGQVVDAYGYYSGNTFIATSLM